MICNTYHIDANNFFDIEEAWICQSCSMPIENVEHLSENFDESINNDYCSICFKEGHFTHNRTLEEMIEHNIKFFTTI